MNKVKRLTFFVILSSFISMIPSNSAIIQENQLSKELSLFNTAKQKINEAINWCRKNPAKTFLIGTGIVVIAISGSIFLINKNKNNLIVLDESYFDKPHKYDGKLPNGEEGPRVCKYGSVSVSQLPGLRQQHGDCVYYSLYNLICLSLNDKDSLKVRTTYQELEKDMKEMIYKDKPETIVNKGSLVGLNTYGILHLLYNNPALVKHVNINPTKSLLIKIAADESISTSEHIRKYFEQNVPKVGESHLFMIKDRSRIHVSAAKATFNSKDDISLEIVDTFFPDASSCPMTKEIASALSEAAQRIK